MPARKPLRFHKNLSYPQAIKPGRKIYLNRALCPRYQWTEGGDGAAEITGGFEMLESLVALFAVFSASLTVAAVCWSYTGLEG